MTVGYAVIQMQLPMAEPTQPEVQTSATAETVVDWSVRDARALQETLAAIVESSDDAIVGQAPDGTITSWNAGDERMSGFPAGEMVGRPLARLRLPGRRPARGGPEGDGAGPTARHERPTCPRVDV